MTCDRIHKLLSSYLEQELSPEEKREFEKHIHQCPECAGLLEHMRTAREALSEWPELEVSSELHSRLLKIGPPEKKKPFWKFDFRMRPSFQPVMAAFTVLMTLLSLFLLHPDKEQIQRSFSRQLHIGYSKIERLYVRAESFTDFLAVYRNNFMNSIKNIAPTGDNEKNGG